MNHQRFFISFVTLLDILLLASFGMLTYAILSPSLLHAHIFSLDSQVANDIACIIPHWLFVFMNAVTYLADPVVMIIFATIVLIILVHIHEEIIGALLSIIFYGFLAYALGRVYKKAWQQATLFISAIVIVGAIGFSRIVIGAHWFSDVIGGWLLGGAILCTLIVSLVRVGEWHAKKWHPDRHFVILGIFLAVLLISFLSVFDLMRYTI